MTLCRLEGEILLYESLHTNLFSVEPLVPHSYKKKTKLEASDLTSSFFFVLYIQLKKGDICMGDVKREYRCLWWTVNILALLENLVYSIYCELHYYIASHSVVHISKSQVAGIPEVCVGKKNVFSQIYWV